MKKGVLVLLIIFVVATCVGAFALSSLKPVSSSEKAVAIDIPVGSNTASIAGILKEKGLIKNKVVFKIFSKVKKYDGTYKAGVYQMSESMNMDEMMKIMVEGKSDSLCLTIPEGLTLAQIAAIFEKKGISSEDEFFEEVENGKFDYKFMKYLPQGKNRLEGFLYPETYFTYKNAGVHDVIDKMLAQFDKLCTEEYYAKAKSMDMDIYKAVTVASLIQRETMAKKEGNKVASVIYNRIEAGMPLGIDAAIQYALPEHKQRLTYEDLKVDSPYNTYTHKGLPPGPICSPEISALEAALNPADTDYIYYVLSPNNDGTHNFSKTYEEFLVNKRKYKESLK